MAKKDLDISTLQQVTLNIPYDAIKASLLEVLEERDTPVPHNIEELVSLYAEKLVATFMDYESEEFIKYRMATGEIQRPGDFVSDVLWENTYTLSQPTKEWFKRNRNKMYTQLIEYDNFGKEVDTGNKEFKRSFIEWIEEAQVDENISLQCYSALRDFFPIEFVRNLGMDVVDMHQFAFSIVEVEKLMKDKKLHKYNEKHELGSAPSNVFFIRWIDGKIRMLSIRYSETARGWQYVTRSIPYQDNKGKHWGISKGSKVFMKDTIFSQ